MARTPGTEAILEAAAHWRDRCLLSDGSVFGDASVWTSPHVAELIEHFVENPDEGSRTFLEKFEDQLKPTTGGAKQLAAEMLWVMFLFPNSVTLEKKTEIVTTIWNWSGDKLSRAHPSFGALRDGVGSGGMGFNSYRPFELAMFVRFLEGWKSLPHEDQRRLINDAWAFAEFLDRTEGADKRQFRHMLLHLLFPDTFERISSGDNKNRIDSAFADVLGAQPLEPNERATTLLARDRRLFRIREVLQADHSGAPLDFYTTADLARKWKPEKGGKPGDDQNGAGNDKQGGPGSDEPDNGDQSAHDYKEPDISAVAESIRSQNLKVSDRTLRRYHLALQSRGFVILSGVSGTGKTWLAEAYARAIGARHLVVPVAPNWTTNEDLLGFDDLLTGKYRDTAFSHFLREGAAEYKEARRAGRNSRPYHLILDEMNLARVEYYFAKFLSAMELRSRLGEARIDLGANESVALTPNLLFIGTVNVDETTHGFADKVYDRAQLLEIPASREALDEHLGAAPYRQVVLEVWDAVQSVAPFAFRVIDDFGRYIDSAGTYAVPWEELIDELLLQKILPKIRGTDPRVGDALSALEKLTAERFPLSHSKVRSMRSGFEQHGVASFF